MHHVNRSIQCALVLAAVTWPHLAFCQANGASFLEPSVERTEIQRPAERSEAERILGPLVLVRPLAPQTVHFLLSEAESQYRFGNPAQAMLGYQTIVAVAPEAAKAWLRIGNLHHQAARMVPALEAYRRSAESVDTDDHQSREKALMNMALIHLESAERALDRLEAEPALVAVMNSFKPGPASNELADGVHRLKGHFNAVRSRGHKRLTPDSKARLASGM